MTALRVALVVAALVLLALWILRGRTGAARAGRAAGADARRAPEQDHRFLLDVCRGDEAEVLRRLEEELRRNPRLGEAQLYRRAIRSWFQEKRGGTHGDLPAADGRGVDQDWP